MLFLYLKAKGVKMRMILGEERAVEKRFLKQMVQFVIFIELFLFHVFDYALCKSVDNKRKYGLITPIFVYNKFITRQ